MIRENQDVFKVFCDKYVEFQMQYTYMDFGDTLINYFFDTLTDQAASNKLNYLVYQTIFNSLKYAQTL